MWITTVFGTVFTGFIAASGIGAFSVALLPRREWRRRSATGLALAGVLALALWIVTSARVPFARGYGWQALGAFLAAVAVPGLIGAPLVGGSRSHPRRSVVRAGLLLTLLVWLALGGVLAFAMACQLDVACDL